MNKTVTMWVAGLISFAFSILTGITMFAFNRTASGNDRIKDELSKKADKTYVDQQLDKKVDKEAFNIVVKNTEETREDVRMILKLLNEKK